MKTSKTLLGEAASMFEEIVACEGCPVCDPRPDPRSDTLEDDHINDCKLEGLVEELREREAFEASKIPPLRTVSVDDGIQLAEGSAPSSMSGFAPKMSAEDISKALDDANAANVILSINKAEPRLGRSIGDLVEREPPASFPLPSSVGPDGELSTTDRDIARDDLGARILRVELPSSLGPVHLDQLPSLAADVAYPSGAEGEVEFKGVDVVPSVNLRTVQEAIVKLFEVRTFVEAQLEDIDAVDPRDEVLTESRRAMTAIRDIITGESGP